MILDADRHTLATVVKGFVTTDSAALGDTGRERLSVMYEDCDVCGRTIRRDLLSSSSTPVPTSRWLGVCGCPSRKWRWFSETGEGLWQLLGDTHSTISTR
jgi:hypothetical protein